MQYHALACDYDGTVAHDGRVDDETIAALGRLRDSGRRLILATGRQLQDLLTVFPHIELFDRVVAENGAVVFCPATREEKLPGERPPPRVSWRWPVPSMCACQTSHRPERFD